jgi:hypothetical protein
VGGGLWENDHLPCADDFFVEYPAGLLFLTSVMRRRFAITLILGLVFQLAQVFPGVLMANAFTAAATACECCEDLPSCPCADEGQPFEGKPSAPIQLADGLKVPPMRVVDSRISSESCATDDSRSAAIVLAGFEEPHGHYAVRLSVAYCTFVI